MDTVVHGRLPLARLIEVFRPWSSPGLPGHWFYVPSGPRVQSGLVPACAIWCTLRRAFAVGESE